MPRRQHKDDVEHLDMLGRSTSRRCRCAVKRRAETRRAFGPFGVEAVCDVSEVLLALGRDTGCCDGNGSPSLTRLEGLLVRGTADAFPISVSLRRPLILAVRLQSPVATDFKLLPFGPPTGREKLIKAVYTVAKQSLMVWLFIILKREILHLFVQILITVARPTMGLPLAAFGALRCDSRTSRDGEQSSYERRDWLYEHFESGAEETPPTVAFVEIWR
ncbi:hypothetical protein KC357_g292 [Hortaea werneckii]|nr:hypothetical protein KC357_g292 [Hortaea werneckii]